jgi:hypothetical protein
MKIKLISSQQIKLTELGAGTTFEDVVGSFVAGDITVHAIAFAIGPKGEREAVLLYSDGATPELPAAVRAWLKDQVA